MRIIRLSPFALLSIISMTFLISCGGQEDGKANPQASGPRAIQAQAITPSKSSLNQKSSSTGTFIAEDKVEISAESSGYLKQINFKEGDYKSKGALLAKIDDAALQAQRSKLLVQLDYAKSEVDRAQKLVDIQAINAEELDRLKNQVNIIESDIQIIDVQINKTNIYAPFSGHVGIQMLSEGTYLSPGIGIAELHRTNPIKLEFFVPEKYVNNIKINDEIQFHIPSSKDTFYTKVYLINPSLEANNRSVRVRCRMDNKSNLFIPGGYADVYYQIQDQAESLLIPAESIIPIIDGQKVLLAKNGKVVSQKVQVGVRTSEAVQILGGLTEKDTVLVTGILSATDGAPVHVTLKESK